MGALAIALLALSVVVLTGWSARSGLATGGGVLRGLGGVHPAAALAKGPACRFPLVVVLTPACLRRPPPPPWQLAVVVGHAGPCGSAGLLLAGVVTLAFGNIVLRQGAVFRVRSSPGGPAGLDGKQASPAPKAVRVGIRHRGQRYTT